MKKVTLLFIFVCAFSLAQNKDKELYTGNEFFTKKDYVDAETAYRISSSKNENKKAISSYNLGTSIYKQDNPAEAKVQFLNSIEVAKSKEEKHKAFHNLGNVFMSEKNYEAAAEAYKNALKNNPYDEETRYNYALAKKNNKENPPKKDDKKGNGGGEDEDKKPNQNPQDQENPEKDKGGKGDNKDKKDSDKGNDDQNKNQGNNREDKNEGDKDEDANGNPKPTGANKQQIENLLEAVNNAEKKIQDKLNAKQVKANPVKPEKDW